jgi:hypothetical protein
MRSGQQDGTNKYTSWLSFCNQVPDHIAYAMAVLDIAVIDQFGRAMPTAVQRDTGATQSSTVTSTSTMPVISDDNDENLGKRKLSTSVGAMNRRRQRQRLKDLRSHEGNENISTITPSSDKDENVGAILRDFSMTESRDQALKIILNPDFGFDQYHVSQARDTVVALAFGQNQPTRRVSSSSSSFVPTTYPSSGSTWDSPSSPTLNSYPIRFMTDNVTLDDIESTCESEIE